MSSLELSKILMCEFHFDYIKNKHGNKSNLIFIDTDSLMYEIKTEDVYNDFRSDKKMFDFSNYSTKPKYYDDPKKLDIGKIKDKSDGAAIEEFVRLKERYIRFW